MRLSRHAGNNLRLYKIPETDIIKTISSPDSTGREGDRLIAVKRFAGRYAGYPLKVVYKNAGDDVLIITAYPLKRKNWR